MKKLDLDLDVCRSLASVINTGKAAQTFQLSDSFIEFLLDKYNLKIQKTTTGYVCFQGFDVGNASRAASSGEALGVYLKARKCHVGEISHQSILDCCEKFLSPK